MLQVVLCYQQIDCYCLFFWVLEVGKGEDVVCEVDVEFEIFVDDFGLFFVLFGFGYVQMCCYWLVVEYVDFLCFYVFY